MHYLFKKLSITLVFLIILVLAICVENSFANLVTNGSFENTEVDTVSDYDVDGWWITLDPSVSNGAIFQVVDDTVQHGNHALKVILNTLGTNAWDIQMVADSILVEPGASYTYSIWAKTDNSGSKVDFTVGNYNYAEYGMIRPATLSEKWREYTFDFTINDQETVIRAPILFSISENIGDVIYIDNLSIEEIGSSGEIWEGPPLAEGKSKFLGCAHSPVQSINFTSYWNQVTPENGSKWGNVESTRDQMNWTELDAAYQCAKDNGFPFRFHVLIWGNQQPTWIEALSDNPEEQLEEIREWFQAVADRYPDIDYLEVVNEPLHDPPDGPEDGEYIDALGGKGTTGWDWVLNAFRMAREIFPSETKLYINDFNIINSSSNVKQYKQIINLLQNENLIDGIGIQAHGFSTTGSEITMRNNLNDLATTGLPIQITEMDVDGQTDAWQLREYKRVFPILWEHPDVLGITLWGWRYGLWRQSVGANIIESNGEERPSLEWLRDYVMNDVSVEQSNKVSSKKIELFQNYPNPFNPRTEIRYQIIKQSHVRLTVYDILGRQVALLVDEMQSAGVHSASFNPKSNSKVALSSGFYFYTLEAGGRRLTRKMLYIR